MVKSDYFDIFDNALKKRPPESAYNKTSEEGQGVSMPPNDRLGPVEGGEVGGPAPRCLGFDCEYISYQDREGRTVLWCSKVNEKVFVIQDCPFENWFKDDKGRIIKKGSKPCPRSRALKDLKI